MGGHALQQLIAGNWKMNGLRSEALALAAALRQGAACDLLVCPPATVLAAVAEALAGAAVMVGGQDCHSDPSGAHTGDVSAPMLRDAGAGWVILGHSERRRDHHETNAQVRSKVVAAQAAGLQTIVCVGETDQERSSGEAQAVVARQLAGSLPAEYAGVVAYEPVWAIGTGLTATPDQAQVVHAFVRERLAALFDEATAGRVVVQYGGSVKPDNAAELLGEPDIDGALIGGASLQAEDFLSVVRTAQGVAAAGKR